MPGLTYTTNLAWWGQGLAKGSAKQNTYIPIDVSTIIDGQDCLRESKECSVKTTINILRVGQVE